VVFERWVTSVDVTADLTPVITLLLALTASAIWAADLRVSVVSLSSPAAPSSDATLEIQTTPGASCSITVLYKSGPSRAKGLGPKMADGKGLGVAMASGGQTQRWGSGRLLSPARRVKNAGATFYTTGMEHSVTSATGTGWGRTPWQGRRNKLPGSPWLGRLLVAVGFLFAMPRRLYFGMIEVIPVTKAAPVLVIATLFVFAGLTLMSRDWRTHDPRRSRSLHHPGPVDGASSRRPFL